MSAELMVILPELILALGAVAALMYGVFRGNGSTGQLINLSVGLLIVVLALVLLGDSTQAYIFADMFVSNGFTQFMKVLILGGAAAVLAMTGPYLERTDSAKFEYPVLVLLATAGMMLMVSSNSLMALYMGLELQSLALYVLAAFRRDTLRSSEAGLKYFVLGALSSGMLLYGMSLVYGYAGTLEFRAIAVGIASPTSQPIGLLFGLVFVAAGLAFKISAVPFHMWTPDVYDGAPLPVTALFATAPKVAAMALIMRVMIQPFGPLEGQWGQIIIFISGASMILGALAGIWQTSIKRLMAYSSIGHIGYALLGLAAGGPDGMTAISVYLAIYLVMNVGMFACMLYLLKGESNVGQISDLAGLAKAHPILAGCLTVLLFSMAGIPPLAGFISKLYVFLAAVDQGLVILAVIGVLSSAVAAFYYIRIIKVMWFDEAEETLTAADTLQARVIIGVTVLAILLLGAFPGVVTDTATAAAATLYGG